MRILLVDDDMQALTVMDANFKVHGHECVACEDPVKALELARTLDFDVVVTDLQMPEMHGIQLIHEIRKHGLQMPIFVITGYCQQERLLEQVRCDIAGLFRKPVSVADLLRGIENATFRTGEKAPVSSMRFDGFAYVTAREAS